MLRSTHHLDLDTQAVSENYCLQVFVRGHDAWIAERFSKSGCIAIATIITRFEG